MVNVVLALKERGVVALPVHDAVVVKTSNEETVRQVMEDSFGDRTGLSIVVRPEDA